MRHRLPDDLRVGLDMGRPLVDASRRMLWWKLRTGILTRDEAQRQLTRSIEIDQAVLDSFDHLNWDRMKVGRLRKRRAQPD